MFRYYLDELEITEPFGFDGAGIKIDQKENNFGRDAFKYDEGVELGFYNNHFLNNLSHGYDYIQSKIALKGADARIVLKVVYNDSIEYYLGRLDLENVNTDDSTFVKCKVIDDGGRFVYKRDFETKKTISTPRTKVLLKAKPVEQISEWSGDKQWVGEQWYSGLRSILLSPNRATTFEFNPFENFNKSDINDSLIPFTSVYANNSTSTPADLTCFKYVNSKSTLNDTTIYLDMKMLVNINTNTPNGLNSTIRFIVHKTYNDNDLISDSPNFQTTKVVNHVINTFQNGNSYVTQSFNENLEFNIGQVLEGEKLFIYFTIFYDNASHPEQLDIKFTDSTLKILTTSTSINSVVEMNNWYDLISETSNLPIDAPIFESGEFKNVYLTNGYGIRSILGKDFITTCKNVNDYDFLAIDSQINSDKVIIGSFEDFYSTTNEIEIDEQYSEKVSSDYNKRFRITDLKFGYDKFEQDRDEQNTLDIIHSYSEWKTPLDYAQGKFSRTTKIIFDVYKIESARRLGFEDRTKNTSLDNDDDLFAIDTIAIGSEINQTHSGVFSQITNGNILKLLTNSFSWLSTGIEIGQNITIDGSNAGTYQVTAINDIGNIISLSGVNSGVDEEELLTINYTLIGVALKTRTFENFGTIEGVANPLNFGNLLFSQKHIENRWSNYLATTMKYYPNDSIKMTYFKGNGSLSINGVADSDDLTIGDIILNEKKVTLDLQLDFEQAFAIYNAMITRNIDGSIGCYLIVGNYSGWISSFNYIFSTEILTTTLELTENVISNNKVYLVDGGIFLTDNGVFITE